MNGKAQNSDPVVLIGLDAVEIDVVEELVAAGRMPHLAKLRRRGRYGRLQSPPTCFLSLVWSTFFTSTRLGDHGWYFNKLWNPEKQRIQYLSPDWLPVRPFWEFLDETHRVVLLDVPFAARPATGRRQMMINGWQCHDDFGQLQHPPDLWREVVARHGRPRMTPEVFGPQTASTLRSLHREVTETTSQFADVCCDFLVRERPDLFLAVFGVVHRGTHYLHDLSQIDTRDLDAATRATLLGARDDGYAELDEALGRIIDAAPSNARIVTFALHGMGDNDGWYEYLPRIVEQIHRGGGAAKPKKGLVFRIKKALPWTLVRQVTRRIPHAWNMALVPLWSRRMYDWSKTRYFTLPMDYNGYIRFNIKGRELEGCLNPGDVEAAIAEVDEALRSFRDIETGKPVIRGTIKVDDLVGRDAPRRAILPDLVVLWDPPHPTSQSCGVVSERYGEVRWPKGQRLASGRSGNHTPHGWLAAAGPGIAAGTLDRAYDSADLIPTVFEWLGAPLPPHFAGRPIAELVGAPSPEP